MTSTYYNIFVITAILAGLLFITATAMFFLFNIPKIIGHLTGYTAKKQIKQFQTRVSVQNSDHLDSFMQEQRGIADKVKSSLPSTPQSIKPAETTDTLNLMTSPTLNIRKETDILDTTQNVQISPETSFLESESNDNDETTGNLNSFDLIFSIEYVHTDEYI